MILFKSVLHQIEFVLFVETIPNLILLFQLKNVDDFDHLKQLPHLAHIYIKNNPLTLQNPKRANSTDDIIRSDHNKLFFHGHSQPTKTKICFEIECFIFLILLFFSTYHSRSLR